MKSIMHKRIIGLLVFMFIITFFSISNVFAAEKKSCENYLTNVKYLDRYNVSIKERAESHNEFVITVNPTSSDTDLQKALRKVVFKVVEINGNQQNGSKTVSYGNSLSIAGDFVQNSSSDYVMNIKLESTEENKDPGCTGVVKFSVEAVTSGSAMTSREDVGEIQSLNVATGKSITCPSTLDEAKKMSNSFEREFCIAKINAKKLSGSSAIDKQRTDFENAFVDGKKYPDFNSSTTVFKCSATKYEIGDDGDYYVNKSYLYGSGITVSNTYTYKYHYSPGEKADEVRTSCKVKCEEAVTVEYGPPVASKAGLCFEYKVRVTSRVSCNVEEAPKKPDTPSEYCTPTPICTNNSHSYYVNQGGPNEEFDSCINTCDGGKYTDKCTNKCYKKVYGSLSSKANATTDLFELATSKIADSITELGYCTSVNSDGCYYRSGSSIMWSGSGEGRWYKTSRWKSTHTVSNYSLANGNGIYRYVYSNGLCRDTCWWSGCSNKKVYLNPNVAKKDKEENEKTYKNAINECKAAASCSTSTATFTISASYTKQGDTKETWIEFPYDNKYDSLTYKNATTVDTTQNKKDSVLLTEDNGIAGCYVSNSSVTNLYRATWSFPGTWINLKTGEISYISKDGSTAWDKVKEKFCIPLDAQNVNEEWWSYYYSKKSGEYTDLSTNSDEYKNTCQTITPSPTVKKWNIVAKTEDAKEGKGGFGYYDWRIEMDCFYALGNAKSTTDNNKCQSCYGESCYRVRSVNNDNLFPSVDGKVGESRTAGFNWSDYSKTYVNSGYVIDPVKLIKKTQSTNIYNNEYLDYYFELSPDDIRKLKNEAKDKNYTNYSGKFYKSSETNNGVARYYSNIIRDYATHAPNRSSKAWECNNMVKYNDNTGCDD